MNPIYASRLEKNLYSEVRMLKDYLGIVEWRDHDDFCLIDRKGLPIYFQRESRLKTPFSIAIFDYGQEKLPDIQPGDRFYRRCGASSSLLSGTWILDLSYAVAIDLNRSLVIHPTFETLSWCKSLLSAEIYRTGNFYGLAGLLELLGPASDTRQQNGLAFAVNAWSQYALDSVILMTRSARTLDREGFQQAWGKIIGLGPGFTPSGDDLLVGFLAVHRLLASPFWAIITEPSLKAVLAASLPNTTRLSSALLLSALQGTFPETVYDLFESLFFKPSEAASPLRKLLHVGHTSGTDLLTGIVLGFMTV